MGMVENTGSLTLKKDWEKWGITCYQLLQILLGKLSSDLMKEGFFLNIKIYLSQCSMLTELQLVSFLFSLSSLIVFLIAYR